MPKKGDYKRKKKESEIYRTESNGNESFREFMYKYKKAKKTQLF